MIVESFSRRVLAALRIVDGVTGQPVLSALSVSGSGTTWVRNRRGYYVLVDAVGLESHQTVLLEPPTDPTLGSITLVAYVVDPSGVYLSRKQSITLPRDPDPTHTGDSQSLFQPIKSRLYPSPTAPVSSAWAVIRATIVREGSDEKLGGALIRVLRATDGEVLARGLSDARGEALVAVPGIPVTTWESSPGPVMGTEVEVQVEVVVDPLAEIMPNPDELEDNRVSLSSSQVVVKLASGRTVVRRLTVAIP
ncbi:MAG: hypothetical protein OEY86_02450 [Nitrospira sp.]|nr:hypothetical protein [Nitrospira sp.]